MRLTVHLIVNPTTAVSLMLFLFATSRDYYEVVRRLASLSTKHRPASRRRL